MLFVYNKKHDVQRAVGGGLRRGALPQERRPAASQGHPADGPRVPFGPDDLAHFPVDVHPRGGLDRLRPAVRFQRPGPYHRPAGGVFRRQPQLGGPGADPGGTRHQRGIHHRRAQLHLLAHDVSLGGLVLAGGRPGLGPGGLQHLSAETPARCRPRGDERRGLAGAGRPSTGRAGRHDFAVSGGERLAVFLDPVSSARAGGEMIRWQGSGFSKNRNIPPGPS